MAKREGKKHVHFGAVPDAHNIAAQPAERAAAGPFCRSVSRQCCRRAARLSGTLRRQHRRRRRRRCRCEAALRVAGHWAWKCVHAFLGHVGVI